MLHCVLILNERDASACTGDLHVQEDESRNVRSQQDFLYLSGDSSIGSGSDSDSDRDFHRTQHVQMSVKQVTENFSKHSKLGLYEFFGDNTKVLSEKDHDGITLDQSQKDFLCSSYKCSYPLFLT
jgi:hypothetical protein